MKKLFIITFCLLLTACSNSTPTPTSDSSSKSTSSINNKVQLTLVEPPQNAGYTEELINHVKQVIEEHPSMGEDGKASMNYADATYTLEGKEYAVFLFSNRSSQTVDRSISFDLSWSYDSQVVFEKQKVLYNHNNRGDLETNQVALMMLEITPEQKGVIDKMNDPKKMKIEISNLNVE